MPDVPRSDRFDDVYFSAEDGPGETAHVFLDGNNLPAAWQGAERFVIGETGFGTGLNFLFAWELFDRTAPAGATLDFVSVEKFPMSAEEIREGLSPWAERLSPYLPKMLAQYPMRVPGFHRMVFDDRVYLTLIFDDANDALEEVEGQVDAWFLDGFTPAKNPDMWTDKVFSEMARLSHESTTFATFTSAGFVKRGLQEAGFSVEKKNGFGRKRDMLAGRFTYGKKLQAPKIKTVAIEGAGLAGCAAAYVLPHYGFDVSLYDPNGIASGASGNSVGIINPRLSSYRTPESDFHTASFAMAARVFLQVQDVEYERCGSVHLITDAEKEKKFTRAAENWGWDANHMRILSPEEASEIAGIELSHGALYLPEGGKINPAKLCEAYARGLRLEKREGDVTLYAHGTAMASDPHFADLKLQAVRGQITFVKEAVILKTNLCYGGYAAPAREGVQVIGSTFQKWMADTNPRVEDDQDNIGKLRKIAPETRDPEVVGHRAALRCAAPDRFPVIGTRSENALISTAYGSHGIAGSLLGAHILADMLRGGPFCVGKSIIKALAPERFHMRETQKTAKKA